MSRQASPAVVGGFVIAAVALILIGILSFGGGRFLLRGGLDERLGEQQASAASENSESKSNSGFHNSP